MVIGNQDPKGFSSIVVLCITGLYRLPVRGLLLLPRENNRTFTKILERTTLDTRVAKLDGVFDGRRIKSQTRQTCPLRMLFELSRVRHTIHPQRATRNRVVYIPTRVEL